MRRSTSVHRRFAQLRVLARAVLFSLAIAAVSAAGALADSGGPPYPH